MENRFCSRFVMVLGVGLGNLLGWGATTYYWTGAEDARWANAANWRVGSATGDVATVPPGKYFDAEGTIVGTAGDTVIFAGIETANTTIDLDGMQSIKKVLVAEGAPSYTFGTGTLEAQTLGIESDGEVKVQQEVVNDQTFRRLGIYSPSGMLWLNNVSPSATLTFNNVSRIRGITKGYGGTFYVMGSGRIVHDGTVMFDQIANVYFYNRSGETVFNNKNTSGSRFASWVFDQGQGLVEIEIPTRLYGQGGSWPWSESWMFKQDTHLYGTGYFSIKEPYNSRDGGINPGRIKMYSGKTLTCDIPMRKDSTSPDLALTGDGTVLLNSTNTLTGSLRLFETIVCGARYLAKKGCTADQTSIPRGGRVVYEAQWTAGWDNTAKVVTNPRGTGKTASTLKYTGTGGETDFDLVISNCYATVRATNAFVNAGTGTFTLSSAVSMMEVETAAFRLGSESEVAPLNFTGSFEAGRTWTLLVGGKTGVGTVKLETAQPALAEDVVLEKGTLEMSDLSKLPNATRYVFAGGKLKLLNQQGEVSLPVAFASGTSGLEVNAGAMVTLSGLDLPLGAALAITAPEGAVVKLAGVTAAASLSAAVTLNGNRAKVTSEGVIVPCVVKWAQAQDGFWREGPKWNSGDVPLATDSVYVDAPGSSYVVTVDDDSAAGSADLHVANAADGQTATVAFKADKVFDSTATVRVDAGGVIGTDDAAATLTFAEGASLSLTDGGAWRSTAGTNRWTKTSRVSMDGGLLAFGGTSVLVLSNRTSNMVFGTGRTEFSGDALIELSNCSSCLDVTPSAAGETAYLVFSERARVNANRDGLCGRIGYNCPDGTGVMDFELAASRSLGTGSATYNHINGWRIGCLNGTGILNLKSGNLALSNAGLHVGCEQISTDKPVAGAGHCPTGIVNQTGGRVEGGSYQGAYSMQVHGVEIGAGQYAVNSGNHYRGIYNLSGGTYAQTVGVLYVGVGPHSEGDFNITGGTFSYAPDYPHNNDRYTHPLLIGFGGGCGRFNMGGGTGSISQSMYVGGALVTDIGLTGKTYHDDLVYAPAGQRASDGTFSITGGTFTVKENVYVGVDGKGTFAIGGTGTFQCGDLVLSNRTASTLAFLLPSARQPGWQMAVTNDLVITQQAKLVLDALQMPADAPLYIKLLSAKNVTGEFSAENVDLRYDTANPKMVSLFRMSKLLYELNGEKGLWLQTTPRGTMVIFR